MLPNINCFYEAVKSYTLQNFTFKNSRILMLHLFKPPNIIQFTVMTIIELTSSSQHRQAATQTSSAMTLVRSCGVSNVLKTKLRLIHIFHATSFHLYLTLKFFSVNQNFMNNHLKDSVHNWNRTIITLLMCMSVCHSGSC